MAPSRRIRQLEAIAEIDDRRSDITGRWPPSTMMLMRPSSWVRTCSAVVHSEAPLRFAEVAVIGMPAALIMASGFGRRNAQGHVARNWQ